MARIDWFSFNRLGGERFLKILANADWLRCEMPEKGSIKNADAVVSDWEVALPRGLRPRLFGVGEKELMVLWELTLIQVNFRQLKLVAPI